MLNASPDVRTQVLSLPELAPSPGTLRGSGIASVLLTNADVDHSAGLLVLREGGAPPIYGTERVRRALSEGLGILGALSAFGPVDFRVLEFERPFEVCNREGLPIGLRATVFPVASKPPPYMVGRAGIEGSDRSGDTVGVLLTASEGSGTLAYVPGVRDLDEALARKLERADVILIDGTFYTDDEMVTLGASTKTARQMGHAPLSGEGGLLEFLSRFTRARKVLVHINNTNPIVRKDSEERRMLDRAGVEVGYDGLAIVL